MNNAKRLLLLLALFAGCSTPPPPRASSQLLLDADRAMLQEQYAKAASLFEQHLSENPNDLHRAELRLQVGKCRLGAGTPDAAIRAFDQALGDQPAQSVKWEILFRRAIAYRMLGDSGRSLEGFRAVALAPLSERGRSITNDELHYEHATALFRAGDFKTGQAELRMVSATGPYERLLPSRLGLSSYTIQVGSFGNENLAAAEAAKLNASTRSISGPRPLYLVLVGTFSKYEEAQKELARLARQGYTDAFILP